MPFEIIPTDEATAMLSTGGKTKPVTVIGTQAIRDTFDDACLQQAINSRLAPGLTDFVLGPQASDPRTRPAVDRPIIRRRRHPDQLPHVSKGRSPRRLQRF